jgi:hypothetical protein
MGWSFKKVALVTGGTLVGGAVCFVTAGAAAPIVGAFVGSTFMGLSGAAATSAGLAALGGGALAAGGGGMVAGAALITTAMTGAGALLGTLGMGTVANFFNDSTKEFEKALHQQKDYAKAQQIILDQEAEIEKLTITLENKKKKSSSNNEKITKLEQVIEKLSEVVLAEKVQLREARAA